MAKDCNDSSNNDPTNMDVALSTLFPNQKPSVWSSACGDLNNDGIDDWALVLIGERVNVQNNETLAVLFGNPDGTFSVPAVSDEFCHVHYHYNMSIEQNILSVQGFPNLHGSSYTLVFKYNTQLGNIVLVGEEHIEGDDERNSLYGASADYLNQEIIYFRTENNKHKEVKKQLKKRNLIGLQGFSCETYNENFQELYFYIDENFNFITQ